MSLARQEQKAEPLALHHDAQALLTHPFKAGIGRLMAETRPLALPMCHCGMDQVLPLGAKAPA